ncbi:conserved Plasmodium protein, unknown function [Plasmodium chabaudi chabaudi]|uniref:Uncharacterized protein n=1 Tax=Plasmodium chabaudi chabaudi TaxID=31271 RepID=A0A1D3RR36_PLACU|nr:conserved Plasmodium protein, unknown function [Plasmodium chabaudi chabaudi]
MENINEESISVSKDEIGGSGKSEQREALNEGEVGEKQVDEQKGDEEIVEKRVDSENGMNMDDSNISAPRKDDNNFKCDNYELQDKKLRSYETHWKGGNTLGNLFGNETSDYIKYNTSPGLLETSENINNEQSKNAGDSKANIFYQINDTEKVCMYNFNPRQLGYRPNNGLNPAQGYVFIYPHTTKNSKPPRIKKKKLTCC